MQLRCSLCFPDFCYPLFVYSVDFAFHSRGEQLGSLKSQLTQKCQSISIHWSHGRECIFAAPDRHEQQYSR